MIVKTTAVVLRTLRYGETSKIVTLWTRDHGRVSVLAKGARAGKRRFGTAVEPGAHIVAVYYHKSSRELQTLSQADIEERYRKIPESLAVTAAMLQMLEVVYVQTHPGGPHPEIYDLLVEGLRAIDRNESGLADVLIAFRLKTASALGFAPSFGHCIRCGRSVTPSLSDRIRYNVRKGGPMCESCEHELISMPGRMSARDEWSETVLSGSAYQRLRRLLHDPLEIASADPSLEEVRNEMESVVRLYERYHLDQRSPLRTSDLVRELIRST